MLSQQELNRAEDLNVALAWTASSIMKGETDIDDLFHWMAEQLVEEGQQAIDEFEAAWVARGEDLNDCEVLDEVRKIQRGY